MSILMDSPNKQALIADIVAYDRDDMPLMVGEVKERIQNEPVAREQLIRSLQAAGSTASFGMLADKQSIQFFAWDGIYLSAPIASLATRDVVAVYDPEFYNKTIYHFYLTALLYSWLGDTIYHWKTKEPPEQDTLRKIGLMERLSGGFIFTEVRLR